MRLSTTLPTRPALVIALVIALIAPLVSLGSPPAGASEHEDPTAEPFYDAQYGPPQIRVEPVWEAGEFGAGAVVAIVDTGIDLGHEDLANNAIPGISFLDCGPEGCGNGDWQSGPEDQRSGNTHGTHVAGTVAAEVNGIGVAGVAPEAGVLAVRVLNDAGSGTLEDVSLGIEWAADNGAHVINLSLGTSPEYHLIRHVDSDQRLIDAVEYASGKGVLVISSAGNDFASICGSPAFYAGGLCIASTTINETKASYSNFVVKEDLYAVAAPGGEILGDCGEGIISTVPAGTGGDDFCGYPDTYDEYAGTSMAAPHVSGAAALLVAQGCTREEIIDILTETARAPGPIEVRGVWDPVYGYGIIDVDAAYERAVTACDAANAPSEAQVGDLAGVTVPRGGSVEIDMADALPDGGRLVAAGNPTNGTADVTSDTTVLYTPDPTYFGAEGFTYSAMDANGSIGVGTITIEVEFSPLPPVASFDVAMVDGEPVVIDVLENDVSLDGNDLGVTDVGTASLGETSTDGQVVTYAPGADFADDATDAFMYTTEDVESGLTDSSRVVVLGPGCLTNFFDGLDPEPQPGWETELAENDSPATYSWEPTQDPYAAEGSQSFYSEAATSDLKDDRLISPPQWISPETVLRFAHRFDFEPGFDGGVLEISIDEGETWEYIASDLFLEGGYNDAIDPNWGNPIAGREAWTGSSGGLVPTEMQTVAVDLSDYAGHEARVRWRLGGDPFVIGSTPGAGWWVDAVAFDGIVSETCAEVFANTPPVAEDVETTAVTATPTRIDVLANDHDPDGDPLEVVEVTQPGNGTVEIVEDGAAVQYTSHEGFAGIDEFTYTVSDGRGGTDSATVTVDVTDEEACERPGRGQGKGPKDGRCPGGGPGDNPGNGPPDRGNDTDAATLGSADGRPGLIERIIGFFQRLFSRG